jgi:hypothetical protein
MAAPNTSSDTYRLYLRDTLLLLYERANSTISTEVVDDVFESGRRLAFYEAISTLISQAKAFELPVDQLVTFDVENLLR